MVKTQQKITFEQYLSYDDGTDQSYELVRGELILITPPIFNHIFIAKFLERIFDAEMTRLGRPWTTVREAKVRTDVSSSRIPDISVMPLAEAEALMYKSAVVQAALPLVVEIVSLSSVKDDYEEKLKEYQAIGIAEYWIVDSVSKDPRVTIYSLDNGTYTKQVFHSSEKIISATFPDLAITVTQAIAAKL
jgi:Uma2 family endonuclease